MNPIFFFLSLFSMAMAAVPNVILMMSDDHGWEETGYNQHPHVKTPVLDDMAATGLKFERFYAAAPSCAPTRASFLTGRHPNRMGTFTPGWSFRPEEITIAHIMRHAGYHTAHFGKWHVGAVKRESPVSPLSMGFHECLSHDNFFEMNPSLSRNGGTPEIFTGESSEILVHASIEAIDRAQEAGKPFFLVIWFGSPHEPYSGQPQDLARYDDLPAKYHQMVRLTSNENGNPVSRPLGEVLRERYAEITAMDRAIGTLRKKLAHSSLRENTLLFYCSDNGTSPESALGLPHRDAKSSFYEGGTLVPGLIEWPARITKPRTTSVRASTSDLLPTLAAISGHSLADRPLDGIDLTPVLDGTITVRPTPLYFWDYQGAACKNPGAKPYIKPELQEGTSPLKKKLAGKFTRAFKNVHLATISEDDFRGARSLIEGDHKFIIHESKTGEPKIELFDLKTDPSEKINVIEQHPHLVKTSQSKLRIWQESILRSLMGYDYR